MEWKRGMIDPCGGEFEKQLDIPKKNLFEEWFEAWHLLDDECDQWGNVNTCNADMENHIEILLE